MATEDEAIALLIENRLAPSFALARSVFGDNAAIRRGKDRLRAMEYGLDLARTQGTGVDVMRRKLVLAVIAYQASLTDALNASASPLDTTRISEAIFAASSLLAEIDVPTCFEALTPSFRDTLPKDA